MLFKEPSKSDEENESVKEKEPEKEITTSAKNTDAYAPSSSRFDISRGPADKTSSIEQREIDSSFLVGRKMAGETDEEYLSRVILIDGEHYEMVDNSYEVRLDVHH